MDSATIVSEKFENGDLVCYAANSPRPSYSDTTCNTTRVEEEETADFPSFQPFIDCLDYVGGSLLPIVISVAPSSSNSTETLSLDDSFGDCEIINDTLFTIKQDHDSEFESSITAGIEVIYSNIGTKSLIENFSGIKIKQEVIDFKENLDNSLNIVKEDCNWEFTIDTSPIKKEPVVETIEVEIPATSSKSQKIKKEKIKSEASNSLKSKRSMEQPKSILKTSPNFQATKGISKEITNNTKQQINKNTGRQASRNEVFYTRTPPTSKNQLRWKVEYKDGGNAIVVPVTEEPPRKYDRSPVKTKEDQVNEKTKKKVLGLRGPSRVISEYRGKAGSSKVDDRTKPYNRIPAGKTLLKEKPSTFADKSKATVSQRGVVIPRSKQAYGSKSSFTTPQEKNKSQKREGNKSGILIKPQLEKYQKLVVNKQSIIKKIEPQLNSPNSDTKTKRKSAASKEKLKMKAMQAMDPLFENPILIRKKTVIPDKNDLKKQEVSGTNSNTSETTGMPSTKKLSGVMDSKTDKQSTQLASKECPVKIREEKTVVSKHKVHFVADDTKRMPNIIRKRGEPAKKSITASTDTNKTLAAGGKVNIDTKKTLTAVDTTKQSAVIGVKRTLTFLNKDKESASTSAKKSHLDQVLTNTTVKKNTKIVSPSVIHNEKRSTMSSNLDNELAVQSTTASINKTGNSVANINKTCFTDKKVTQKRESNEELNKLGTQTKIVKTCQNTEKQTVTTELQNSSNVLENSNALLEIENALHNMYHVQETSDQGEKPRIGSFISTFTQEASDQGKRTDDESFTPTLTQDAADQGKRTDDGSFTPTFSQDAADQSERTDDGSFTPISASGPEIEKPSDENSTSLLTDKKDAEEHTDTVVTPAVIHDDIIAASTCADILTSILIDDEDAEEHTKTDITAAVIHDNYIPAASTSSDIIDPTNASCIGESTTSSPPLSHVSVETGTKEVRTKSNRKVTPKRRFTDEFVYESLIGVKIAKTSDTTKQALPVSKNLSNKTTQVKTANKSSNKKQKNSNTTKLNISIKTKNGSDDETITTSETNITQLNISFQTKKVSKNKKSQSPTVKQSRKSNLLQLKSEDFDHMFDRPAPEGWKRVAVQRQSGASAGKYDVYFFNSDGQKFRSRPEVASYLQQNNITEHTLKDFQFAVLRADGAKGKSRKSTQNIVVKEEKVEEDEEKVQEKEEQVQEKEKQVQDKEEQVQDKEEKVQEKKEKVQKKKTNTKKQEIKPPKTPVVKVKAEKKSTYKSPLKMLEESLSKKTKKTKVTSKVEKKSKQKVPAKTKTGQKRQIKPKKSQETQAEFYNELLNWKTITIPLIRCDGVRDIVSVVNRTSLDIATTSNIAQHNAAEHPSSSKEVTSCSEESTGPWIPPKSPFGLIYEKLYMEPWKLLIATIIKTKSEVFNADHVALKFFDKYPTLKSIQDASFLDLDNFFNARDVSQECTEAVTEFALECESKLWTYPIELSSIDKYGNDVYRIFCVEEWKQVRPDDYELSTYQNWLYQNEDQLHK